jgi:hypothetical protein
MANRFDVAARLDEGRPAVERTQTYVQACHELGYQQADLTAHPARVWDWYDTEAGLDLRVLDNDCAELRAAANAIDEALWVQRAQVTELAAAWRGPGADSAARFLRRHSDAAAEVAAYVHAAAEGCAALRDDAWQAVDGKVAGATAIDERRAADRSAWLAAAHTVTTGMGDRSAAEETIQRQVMPYVDNDIRIDWVGAMRSATASVTASFDAAIHALTSTPEVRFEVPGELGPSSPPVLEEPLPLTPAASPIATVPAAAPAPPPPITEAPQQLSTSVPDELSSLPPDMATPLGDAGGLSTGAGNLGGAGGLAGSIGGVIGQIVDSIGGLLGSLAGGLGDTSSDPLVDDPLDADDPPVEDDRADDTDDPAGAAKVVEDDAADKPAEQATESPPPPAEAVGEPVAQEGVPPVDPSPPAVPPPADQSPMAAAPQPAGATPCEIAEDELPQAGQ